MSFSNSKIQTNYLNTWTYNWIEVIANWNIIKSKSRLSRWSKRGLNQLIINWKKGNQLDSANIDSASLDSIIISASLDSAINSDSIINSASLNSAINSAKL